MKFRSYIFLFCVKSNLKYKIYLYIIFKGIYIVIKSKFSKFKKEILKKSLIFFYQKFSIRVCGRIFIQKQDIYIFYMYPTVIYFSPIYSIWKKKAVKTRNILYWISNWKSFILLLSCSIMMAFYEILFPGPCFPSFLLGFSLFFNAFSFSS